MSSPLPAGWNNTPPLQPSARRRGFGRDELEDFSEEQVMATLQESFSIISDDRPIFRIQFDGHLVRTRSGKTAWSGRGPAMNALHCHMDSAFPSLGSEDRRRLTRTLLDENIIRIIEEGTNLLRP